MASKPLSELDAALESYLGKIAGESAETRTRQAESVRVHYATPAAGLALPAGQAAASGLFIGAAFFGVAILADWPKPWAWGLITWLLIQAVAWLLLLTDWRRIVINRLEELTRRDLNGDAIIGSPPPPPLRVELSSNGGRTVEFIDLPGGAAALAELARGVMSGATLAESNWTGEGRPFKRAVFAELRSELVRRGLAAWNSPGTPARGIVLTGAGRAIFRHLAAWTPSPTGQEAQESA